MALHGGFALGFRAGLLLGRYVLQHFEIGRDALGLDRAAGRGEIARRGDCQCAVAGTQRHDRLYRALAERAGPDQGRALVIVQRAGHDLGRRGRSAVDQDDERLALDEIAGSRREALRFLRGAAPGRDDLAARQERAGHGNRLIEQPARVIAQVDDVAGQLARRDLPRYIGDRLLQGIGGLFVEGGDPDIADIATLRVIAHRPHVNHFAHDRNLDRRLGDLADDLQPGLGVDRSLHLVDGLLQGQPLDRFAIDVGDEVA